MVEIPPIWGEFPPNWGVYFAVDDLESALAAVAELGGAQLVPAMSVAGIGSFSMVRDPQNGQFSLIQFEQGS